MDKRELIDKVITFFEPKGLTDEQRTLIASKIENSTDDELKCWEIVVQKIDNHEVRIASTIETLQDRRIDKINYWKNRSVSSVGVYLTHDSLTDSVDDFLTKQLKAVFGD